MEKIDIKSLEYQELKELISKMNHPAYRAGQIFSWLHEKLCVSFDEMTNIPSELKKELSEKCEIYNVVKEEMLISQTDGTRKYAFRLHDGQLIESVLMKYIHGNSVCVSSQAGCDMGCSFCASTINGCKRNLMASEILGQVYEIQKDTKERVSNVVIMGMGEPLINYNNVLKFIKIISCENGLHISQRNITMSTCGIVPAIRKMAEESLKITLALSLHAPDDEVRRKIMPIAKKYSIAETIEACEYYFSKTGRRVTFEYCIIRGINDTQKHAVKLAALLKGKNAHVNLIPVNPVSETGYESAKENDIRQFIKILEGNNITVTKRREMGRDIKGACGQLVRRKL